MQSAKCEMPAREPTLHFALFTFHFALFRNPAGGVLAPCTRRRKGLSVLLGALLLAGAGCRAAPLPGHSLRFDSSSAPVSQAVVLWSEAAINQDGTPVGQGFTAKVYLLGGADARPVATSGKVTVYAYDDTLVKQASLEQLDPRPTKTWEFSAAQLEREVKKDAIGPYYTLWLPYGPVSESERRCTLRLCFTPPKGRRVLSEPAQVTLPGVGGKKTKTAS
jgi:hypothetical protein